MTKDDDYVLGRSISDSIRLDAQHLLWKMHTGYELHPGIPVTDDMKIAEVGTGTAVWIFDLARKLPSTIRLYGFDISDAQFPIRKLWPKNVTLDTLDSLTEPPASLAGQFDVVHLRMWASNLRGKNTILLINHVKSLLKPGGFIQWEEADLVHQYVEGPKAEAFEREINEVFEKVGLDYSWVSRLADQMRQVNFRMIEAERKTFDHDLKHLCTNTYLLALREILQGIKRLLGSQSLLSVTELELQLHQLTLERADGIIYNWSPVTLLVQKNE
ncbi:hypothetical protein N7539_005892 [Penicillium diatomitis]|uniref:Methyltransferase type 12 domain-containing protein n=1 Tax=Penicillium diatomitis TaxID=2819901 RepID=A0A9W9X5B6_9EURO|nr:uncharacterized protein N7539_005892 [Penicillium diatomitis]KAJ5484096.1 hypothetical protein N7539_005892 [Penicillium diatomitis]